MKLNKISVSSIVSELVKNSIDAKSTIVHIEFNELFDVRIIDNGCGFDEYTLEGIGERQIFLAEPLKKRVFRYGKNGRSLFKIAEVATEIVIESIKHKSDERFFKKIRAKTSDYNIYKAERKFNEALVKSPQGSMVMLNSLNLSIGDAAQVKASIIDSVVELALINYQLDFLVQDSCTQQTVYESYRSVNLLDKFEQFLQCNQFFSNIQSISCQKHDVKVELFICEEGISSKALQYVYVNKLGEHNGKWSKFINKLCRKKFENDLNSKFPVYLLNVCAENYQDNQLSYNIIIDKCIRKCVEELSQPPPKATVTATKPVISQKLNPNKSIRAYNEVPHENGNQLNGVRLGDWIFNNSFENYNLQNRSKEMYRRKICENWVLSLEKPKPKDTDDSLMSVAKEKRSIHQDGDLFKMPQPRKKTKTAKQSQPKLSPLPLVSTQIYKPSQKVEAFNNSGLMRASKKLIQQAARENEQRTTRKRRIDSQLEGKLPKVKKQKTLLGEAKAVPTQPFHQIDPIDSMPDITFGNLNDNEMLEALEPLDVQFNKSTRNGLDFALHESVRAINSNVNVSSSIFIHTVNDSVMGFVETNVNQMHSVNNFFEANVPSANNAHVSLHSESNRPRGSSFYSETSALRFRRHRNESIQTQYRQRTYCNFSRNNSLRGNRHETHFRGASENPPLVASEKLSNPGTSVVPVGRRNSSLGIINDNVRQAGWPVTININFGQAQ